MNRMEFPEFGDLVIPTMCPISKEIEQEEGDDWLDVAWNHIDQAEIKDDEA